MLGVFFFAVSGSLLAARKRFDIVASLILASLTGLGGGVVRDVIIGAHPPAAFAQPLYFLPPVIAVVLVFFFFNGVTRFRKTLLLSDAGGLGMFCVAGTVKAIDFGVNPLSAALLGVTTAVGGGLLRDVVANVVPSILRQDDIYALPALIGAGLTALLVQFGLFNAVTAVLAALLTITLRALSIKFRWHLPLATPHSQAPGD
ncbi:trimeric intracellular cation channel family protein [Saxibacter everestensis]|uniref:Trimeric intracellular cation channel family protein n=1 Tax=Saxibacter everestensis TaxID=2909229 RepID=A0ABY8QYJ4_9MICO|nr:trimeric intracellular cation channel family protein [Brevibacteriaceae bacterium ZFBP1038]